MKFGASTKNHVRRHRQRRDSAFAVPAFGIKRDAIPGFVRDTWFRAEKIGDRGRCQNSAEEHAVTFVKVVSAADYTAWVAVKTRTAARAVVASRCRTLWRGIETVEKKFAAASPYASKWQGAGPIKALGLDFARGAGRWASRKRVRFLLNGLTVPCRRGRP
jgi:cytochrome c oxidase subunit 2